jgi:hypothetical protein
MAPGIIDGIAAADIIGIICAAGFMVTSRLDNESCWHYSRWQSRSAEGC